MEKTQNLINEKTSLIYLVRWLERKIEMLTLLAPKSALKMSIGMLEKKISRPGWKLQEKN